LWVGGGTNSSSSEKESRERLILLLVLELELGLETNRLKFIFRVTSPVDGVFGVVEEVDCAAVNDDDEVSIPIKFLRVLPK